MYFKEPIKLNGCDYQSRTYIDTTDMTFGDLLEELVNAGSPP